MKIFTKLFYLIFIFLLLITSITFASSGKISGKVVDAETGEPLVGVNIIIRGTHTGVASDIDGFYFIINLNPGVYTLEASYIGYEKTIIERLSSEIVDAHENKGISVKKREDTGQYQADFVL